MKWKNIDIGPCYYYITGTITEWLPLLSRQDIRQMVCADIQTAINVCGGSITAFVVMPDHVHLLVFLPGPNILHEFNKLWRGRSGRHIPAALEQQNDWEILSILAKHANGGCNYAVWKEQVRAIAIWSEAKLHEKINYIHENPIRRKLAVHPGDWEFSSWRYYECNKPVCFDLVPIDI